MQTPPINSLISSDDSLQVVVADSTFGDKQRHTITTYSRYSRFDKLFKLLKSGAGGQCPVLPPKTASAHGSTDLAFLEGMH
jgi:hypothetical protein